jgi:alpha-mannosidase
MHDGSLQPLNQLVIYEDRPRSWEAWDIDADYELKPALIDSRADRIEIVDQRPLRAEIVVERTIGRDSRMTQRYRLDQNSPRLDVITRIDWREEHRLLRALFPVNVRSRFATYDIQFGHIQRSTTRNTTIEKAMFEVCAHQWMDISEHDFGVAILNDGKYGCSCDGHVMGLSLLRSPKWPDPTCDMGVHEFTYSVMPHRGAGDWRAAGVDRQAALLNAPLFARPGAHGEPLRSWSPFTITGYGANAVTIAALKRAEAAKDDRLILRLVESHGGRNAIDIQWHLPIRDVVPVDLLEQPRRERCVQHDGGARRTSIALRPFQIVTLAITLDQPPLAPPLASLTSLR